MSLPGQRGPRSFLQRNVGGPIGNAPSQFALNHPDPRPPGPLLGSPIGPFERFASPEAFWWSMRHPLQATGLVDEGSEADANIDDLTGLAMMATAFVPGRVPQMRRVQEMPFNGGGAPPPGARYPVQAPQMRRLAEPTQPGAMLPELELLQNQPVFRPGDTVMRPGPFPGKLQPQPIPGGRPSMPPGADSRGIGAPSQLRGSELMAEPSMSSIRSEFGKSPLAPTQVTPPPTGMTGPSGTQVSGPPTGMTQASGPPTGMQMGPSAPSRMSQAAAVGGAGLLSALAGYTAMERPNAREIGFMNMPTATNLPDYSGAMMLDQLDAGLGPNLSPAQKPKPRARPKPGGGAPRSATAGIDRFEGERPAGGAQLMMETAQGGAGSVAQDWDRIQRLMSGGF